MTKRSLEVIDALRKTARQLAKAGSYQWGHMGACNCGFLVQQITLLSKDEIHRRAMQKPGDWSEQLNDYCATSGLPMDELINALSDFGFDCGDLRHLERLSDPSVLQRIPPENRNLHYNVKQDVIHYLTVWSDMLEEELLAGVTIGDLHAETDLCEPEVQPHGNT